MIDKKMRDSLFEIYDTYVDTFEVDGELTALSTLKYEHSKRVAVNARQIAVHNKFSQDDVYLAEVCGLFHDVGRYSQLLKYGTFKDAQSINHGECGYQVLLEMGWLESLSEKARECIQISTRLHNVKNIPDDIKDEQVLRFLHLVRDSDKIDIYYVFHDAITNGNLEKYPEIVHDLELGVGATESIVEAILNNPHAAISYNDAASMADFLLIPVQWSYDLHSFGSYWIMNDRQVLQKMKEIMPDMQNKKIAMIMESAIQNVTQSLENYQR